MNFNQGKGEKVMQKSLLIGLAGVACTSWASELVYSPTNPSFGGNPLNGSYLLGNAQAQNDTSASTRGGSFRSSSALDRFTTSLQSRLLSQLLADVGEGNTGSLVTDDFVVEIVDDSGTLSVVVTDRITEEVTIIEVNGLNPNN